MLHGKVSIWCSSTTADWLLPHGQAWASPGSMHCELQNVDMIYAVSGHQKNDPFAYKLLVVPSERGSAPSAV